MLMCHDNRESKSPAERIIQSALPVIIGPIKIDAKNTCPISLKISDKTFDIFIALQTLFAFSEFYGIGIKKSTLTYNFYSFYS